MNRTHLAVAAAAGALHFAASASCGEETLLYDGIVAGFVAHVQPCSGGRIDWTGGFIIAEGRGIAETRDNQGQLLAKRAATLDAAANALAIAVGINVDAHGRAGEVRDGRVALEGTIKGHEVTDVTWRPDRAPPEMHVRLKVPLWGLKSVCSVCYDTHRQRVARSGVRTVPLIVDQVDVADAVLIIDARGTGLEASLFPVVITDSGDLLYDVSRLASAPARRRPAARFVETDVAYEQLLSRVEDGAFPPVRLRARLASYAELSADVVAEAESPASQPASQPVESSRRRPRRRVVVKGTAATGEQKTRLVITAEDAEKLRRSPEGASLLRQGQVVIVVDSAAAGTQGRRDPWPGQTPVLARSLSP